MVCVARSRIIQHAKLTYYWIVHLVWTGIDGVLFIVNPNMLFPNEDALDDNGVIIQPLVELLRCVDEHCAGAQDGL